MSKNIGIALIVITVLGIGFVVFFTNKKDTTTVAEVADMAQPDQAQQADEMQKDEAQPPTAVIGNENADEETVPLVSPGSYQAYSPDKIAMAATGDVVLFFHASWCPTCRALSDDIEENVTAIPEGLTILKTDYDTQTELKKKYGVTTQHTLVQVDANGNLIKKWSGGSKLQNIVSQLQ